MPELLNRVLRWIPPEHVDVSPELLEVAGGSRLLAEALVRRGWDDPAAARAALCPEHYRPADPCDLPDLDRTAGRLLDAVAAGERIGVWGDFDVDGQTATAVLVDTLRKLGADVIYHIPVRERESHSVNIPGLEKMLQRGARLVLTCDTGITAHDAALYAASHGVDFLVTDHHTPGETLPQAYSVVNPHRLPPGHPLGTLPGVGVAFKLAEELLQRAGQADRIASVYDLVALGAVADVAELSGDTRYLVQKGLAALRSNPRPAVQAMVEQAGVDPLHLDEEDIGFSLAPRLNAVGRLSDANPMVEFLLETDMVRARVTAQILEGLNAKRKMLCDEVFQGALAELERTPDLLDLPVLVLAHPHWHAGVIGIVASRLVDLYGRPVILLSSREGQPARGSARSVNGINITEAIASQAERLLGFGGHAMAAGLSLPAESIPAFRAGLARYISQQTAEQPPEVDLPVDALLPLADISLDLVDACSPLAPFGNGNPPLTFLTQKVFVRDKREIGQNGDHLRVLVQNEAGDTRNVIWWQAAGNPLPEGYFDLAFTLRAHTYRGKRDVQVEWLQAFPRPEEKPPDITTRIEVVDLRHHPHPDQMIAGCMQTSEVMVWSEACPTPFPEVRSRCRLEPAPALAVWSIPPGPVELANAIEDVHPGRVFLCACPPEYLDPPAFLRKLTGLVRYALQKKNGLVTLDEMAAVLGQRRGSVLLGLNWLQARGDIDFIPAPGGAVRIAAPGSTRSPDSLPQIENGLKMILEETRAYREYYLRAEAASLIPGSRLITLT